MCSASAHPPDSIPSLDGIRALSVLLVILAHSGYGHVVPGGLGVTIFFFLSGYLITTLLLAEHVHTTTISIGRFYVRRMLRLLPPLLLTLLLAYTLVGLGILSGGMTVAGLASQIFYFANYYSIFFDPGMTFPSGTGVIWSLAVEEHFYVLYPIALLYLLNRRLPVRTISLLLVATCVIVLVWRVYLVEIVGVSELRTYYASDTRIDSIIYGCLLGIIAKPGRGSQQMARLGMAHWLLLLGSCMIVLITLAYKEPKFRETYRYSLQGLALLPIFYCAIRFSRHPMFIFLNWSIMKRIGVYSYAMYLIHHVVIIALRENVPWFSTSPIALSLGALTLSVVYAALLDRYVEPYFRRMRSGWRGSDATLAHLERRAT